MLIILGILPIPSPLETTLFEQPITQITFLNLVRKLFRTVYIRAALAGYTRVCPSRYLTNGLYKGLTSMAIPIA